MVELTERRVSRGPERHRWTLLACVVCWAPLEELEDRLRGACAGSCSDLARESREVFDAWIEDDLAPGSPAAARWKSTMKETIDRRRARAVIDDKENHDE